MNLDFRLHLLAAFALIGLLVGCSDLSGPQSAAPKVFIEEPSDSVGGYLEGDAITFRGSAIDPEDGAIPSSSLLWVSDVDGPLGIGSEIIRSDLTAAAHQIILIAEDSDGVRGADSVGIVVGPSGPQ